MSYYEHHKRSIAKTIGFHALVIAADAIVIYLITGRYMITLNIVILTNLVSAIIYFLHERAWNRVHWGKSHIEIDLPK